MPIRELGHFTVRRFFRHRENTLRRLHARGRAGSRSRLTRSARAHPREGPCGRARVVFQLSRDLEPAERNVVSALTGALFTHCSRGDFCKFRSVGFPRTHRTATVASAQASSRATHRGSGLLVRRNGFEHPRQETESPRPTGADRRADRRADRHERKSRGGPMESHRPLSPGGDERRAQSLEEIFAS